MVRILAFASMAFAVLAVAAATPTPPAPTPTPPAPTPAPPPTPAPEIAVQKDSSECDDVDAPRTGGTCFGNVTWALETGLRDHPEYYVNYTTVGNKYYVDLTSASTHFDMQCVLWHMRDNTHTVSEVDAAGEAQAGEGHACPIPCHTNFTSLCAPPTPPPAFDATTESPTTAGVPWWVWLLVGVLVVGAILAAIYAFCMPKEKKAPKKKRALQLAAGPPPPVPLQPQPVMTYVQHPRPVQTHTVMVPVAQPLPVTYVAPAVHTVQAPQQIQTYAAPAVHTVQVPQQIQTYAAPAVHTVQAPQIQYVQPVQQEIQYQSMSLFDQIDSNHNGTITRAELDAAMASGMLQQP